MNEELVWVWDGSNGTANAMGITIGQDVGKFGGWWLEAIGLIHEPHPTVDSALRRAKEWYAEQRAKG